MKNRSHRAGKLLKGLWLALVLAFLYIPIIVMIALGQATGSLLFRLFRQARPARKPKNGTEGSAP